MTGGGDILGGEHGVGSCANLLPFSITPHSTSSLSPGVPSCSRSLSKLTKWPLSKLTKERFLTARELEGGFLASSHLTAVATLEVHKTKIPFYRQGK